MSIQGSLAASLRRFDPYPELDLVFDPKGLRTEGQPFFKLGGRQFQRPEDMPGWTYARAGADLIVETARGLRRFAANRVPFVPGHGLECAEATTNKCLNHNLAPASLAGVSAGGTGAVLSLVARDALPPGVRAALEADDPLGMAPALVKAEIPNNGSANNVLIDGVVGTTEAHSVSARIFVEAINGSLTLGYSANDSQGEVANAPSTAFTKVKRENIVPASTGRTAALRMGSSGTATVYFYLNQLEAKPYATASVPVAGAQASRGAQAAYVEGATPLLHRPGLLIADAEIAAIDGQTRALASLSDGGESNRVSLRRDSSNRLIIPSSLGGALTNVIVGAGYAGARRIRAAVRIAADRIDHSSGGSAVGGQALATAAAFQRLTFGSDALGSGVFLNSPLGMVGLASAPVADAEMQRLSSW